MWRKTDEANPSSPASEIPTPAPSNTITTSPMSPSKATPMTSMSVPVNSAAPAGLSEIVPGLRIQGEISGSSDLYIDGEVQGSIRMGGAKVTVGPNGRVQADIEARAIAVEGNVRGNLRASEGIYLGAHGHAKGSFVAPKLGIEEGARVSGKVDMKRPGESRNETGGAKRTESVAIRRVAVGESQESDKK